MPKIINKFEDENQWKITKSLVGEYGSDSTNVYCNDTEIKAVKLKVEWGEFSDYEHTLTLTIKIPKKIWKYVMPHPPSKKQQENRNE